MLPPSLVVATTLSVKFPWSLSGMVICSPARSSPVEGPGVAGARAAVIEGHAGGHVGDVIVPGLSRHRSRSAQSAMVRLADEPSLTLTAVCVPARLADRRPG